MNNTEESRAREQTSEKKRGWEGEREREKERERGGKEQGGSRERERERSRTICLILPRGLKFLQDHRERENISLLQPSAEEEKPSTCNRCQR